MFDQADLIVRVTAAQDDDREDVLELTRRLRAELLMLDVEAVESAAIGPLPAGSKGIPGLGEMLGIRLGAAAVKAVVAKLHDWVSRNGRSVEVSIDGDTIKLTGVTAAQQEQLINVWLARHAPDS